MSLVLPDTTTNNSIIIVVMEEEEEEDNEEVKKAFGDFAERLDDDTRLEALRGLERKMMISDDDFVDDGDTKNVGCIVENVERHLERRLKEDFEDDDDVNDDEFNHHSKKGEKRSKSARFKNAKACEKCSTQRTHTHTQEILPHRASGTSFLRPTRISL